MAYLPLPSSASAATIPPKCLCILCIIIESGNCSIFIIIYNSNSTWVLMKLGFRDPCSLLDYGPFASVPEQIVTIMKLCSSRKGFSLIINTFDYKDRS